MNNIKKYKGIHQTPAHFILHDGKATFHVAKRGLDKQTMDRIQGFFGGGEIQQFENGGPVKSKKQQMQESVNQELGPADTEATPAEKIQKKVKEYLPFNEGGEVPQPEGSGQQEQDMEEMRKQAEGYKAIMKEFYDRQVPSFVNGGEVPAEIQNQVDQEAQALAVNQTAMPNMNIDNSNPLPMTAQPLNPEAFKQQAITNVGSQIIDERQQAADAEKVRQEQLTAQAVADQQKLQQDNAIRMQAGLPAIPGSQPVVQPQPGMPSPGAPNIVAPEDQISFMPKQEPTKPQVDLVGRFDKNMAQITEGVTKNAQLQNNMMQQQAKAQAQFVQEQQQRAQEFQKEQQQMKQHNDELQSKIESGQIDPNRMWNSLSTGNKVTAGLGVFLSGVGSGILGQSNQALSYLQKTIDNDIEAQKADKSNQINAYKLGLEKYRDVQAAEQFARLQANTILAGQMSQIANKIGGQQAIQVAKSSLGEMAIKNDQLRNELALKQVALNYTDAPKPSGANKSAGINTGKMTAYMNAGLYDDATKKELIKEQGEYIKLKNLVDIADNVFKEASDNATWTNRVPGSHLLPDFREKTKLYESQVNSFLDRITKDTTGRVTPESMKNIRSSMPLVDDSPETVQRKKAHVQDLIKGMFEFPALSNKGLLNTSDPYITSIGNTEAKFTQGPPKLK
jgi:hypothetical protein